MLNICFPYICIFDFLYKKRRKKKGTTQLHILATQKRFATHQLRNADVNTGPAEQNAKKKKQNTKLLIYSLKKVHQQHSLLSHLVSPKDIHIYAPMQFFFFFFVLHFFETYDEKGSV